MAIAPSEKITNRLSMDDRRLQKAGLGCKTVPSAVVPVEMNYLLNPKHAELGKAVGGELRPFAFDDRLVY